MVARVVFDRFDHIRESAELSDICSPGDAAQHKVVIRIVSQADTLEFETHSIQTLVHRINISNVLRRPQPLRNRGSSWPGEGIHVFPPNKLCPYAGFATNDELCFLWGEIR